MLNHYKSMLKEINKLIDEKIKNNQNYDNLANIHSLIVKTSLKMPHSATKTKTPAPWYSKD